MAETSQLRYWLLSLGLELTAWTTLAAIVVMTLGPVSVRPHTPLSANFDRLAAYVVLGFFFALAYPRRMLLLAVALIVVAGGLEWAQSLVPGRDARLEDFLFKATGSVIGLGAARLVHLIFAKHLPLR